MREAPIADDLWIANGGVGFRYLGMRKHTTFLVVAALFAAFAFTSNLQAQPLVSIETVTVGDPGNAADTTGYGAVSNVFAIGKYEVTIGQYTTFLNSVAASDPYFLYKTDMGTNLTIAGIVRSGSEGSYTYSVLDPSGLTPPGASSGANRPISFVSWFNAARFANWMHNGAIVGASTETGAYTLNGAIYGTNFTRNLDATWWIPAESEWYKAAYYKGGGTNAGYWIYPTQSDFQPSNDIESPEGVNHANYREGAAYNQSPQDGVGVFAVTQLSDYDPSQNYLTDIGVFSNSGGAYGTFDQGGGVFEWNEEIFGGGRGIRGGSATLGGDYLMSTTREMVSTPALHNQHTGFRLATVPEPSTYALLLMTGAGALWLARRRR